MSTNDPDINNNPNSSQDPQTNETHSSYSADNIIVLEGLEGVRKRPAMYIGSTGKRGFHHLAFEVIDNSIDENMGGYCKKVRVTLDKDGSCKVFDDGRGIPVAIHPKKHVSTLEVIFSSLHSGGKFDKKSYAVSGGLHGVGLAVVNACCKWGKVEVWREGSRYELNFAQGKILGHTQKYPSDSNAPESGTEVSFYPDPEIFTSIIPEEYYFDYDFLASRLRDLAFLNKIEIELIDKREGQEKSDTFKFENGLTDFVTFLNKSKKHLNQKIIQLNKKSDGVIVDLALQYNESYTEVIYSFVNNIHTIEGGTHLTGFRMALTRFFNNYLKDHPKLTKGLKEKQLKGSDVREGLAAVISVMVPEPQFEGQTKTKLGNPEVKKIVSDIVFSEMNHYFDQHPEQAAALLQKSLTAQRARIASQKARDLTRRKSVLDGLRLPGKLADFSSKEAKDCEIFIVEGDSAGGSAKQGRDRATQAILPLRGKILNVEKARLGKILANKEIASMIKAIGIGIDQNRNGEEEEDENEENDMVKVDLSSLRYHKLIIMCDADVDGHHIETLLLTFFFRFMRTLIEEGHVYLAVPPIYKLSHGKHFKYLYIEDDPKLLQREIDLFTTEHNIKDPSKIKTQRFKGLGEMNPEELWDTTMDPSTRRLHRIKFEDFVLTDNMFAMLMGDEVEPRRNYIMENYNKVLNLDI